MLIGSMFEEGLPMQTNVQSTRDTATNVGSEGKKVFFLFILYLIFFLPIFFTNLFLPTQNQWQILPQMLVVRI